MQAKVTNNCNQDQMKTPQLPPFDYAPRAYAGPSADEVLALRKQFINPTVFTYYKKPIMIAPGQAPLRIAPARVSRQP